MAKRKCLVAGGAGFLGSHLCEKLLQEGNEVLCVDNLSTGSKENIVSMLSHPLFSFIEHDICRALYVDADEIYNVAAFASYRASEKKPIESWKVNLLGSLHMLELAKRNRAKILQVSSSSVYGDSSSFPQKEEDFGKVNPVGVRACFEEGKRAAEALFFDFYREHQVPVKIVRLFHTYGPRMSLEGGGVIAQFLQKALQKLPLVIQGKGEKIRSFCYVEDAVSALILMMKSESWILGPVNIGGKELFSIEKLAKTIIKETKSNSSIQYEKGLLEDPSRMEPDLSLAKKLLGWEPKTSFEEGLKKTASYFSSSLTNSLEKLKEEDAFLSL